MNFYPHHIGDFDKATRHSTRLERSIYRDLMDLYYDTEQPLPLDLTWICKKIIARTNEESTVVEQVLNEFFTETATGWYHARCEDEISKYHANTSQKSLAGKASAAAKALKKQHVLNGKSTAVERQINGTSTNQEPLTNNQYSPSLRSGEDAGKPAARKKREDTNLKTYLETCKADGVKPIPADHPIRSYCADAHITDEMLQLAWIVFKDRFTVGKDKAKRQKDWPAHFANAVRGRWANLWHTTEKGETCWTSAGLQERAVAEARMKPQGDAA